MNFAKVCRDAGTVISPDGERVRRINRKIGPFVIHKSFEHSPSYVVTVPCGAALGFYRKQSNAVRAAKIMAPLVVDPKAETLEGLFGSMEAGRNAYDLTRAFRDSMLH
jgi:hypothetical protein